MKNKLEELNSELLSISGEIEERCKYILIGLILGPILLVIPVLTIPYDDDWFFVLQLIRNGFILVLMAAGFVLTTVGIKTLTESIGLKKKSIHISRNLEKVKVMEGMFPDEPLKFGQQKRIDFAQLLNAIHKDDVDLVKKLIKSGINVNHKDSETKQTALMEASKNGRLEIVKLLIESGAKVNVKNKEGLTPLQYIIDEECSKISIRENIRVGIVEELINAGADIDLKIVRYPLLPPPRKVITPLMIASENGYLRIVKRLIDAGADVNAQYDGSNTALLYAIIGGGHIEIVRELIKAGADVNAKNKVGLTPLHCAARDHPEIAKILIEAEANVNAVLTIDWSEDPTALMTAVSNGHIEVVKMLLERGADVNVKSPLFKRTPLMVAEYSEHKDIVNLLKKAGAKE
jgi:ankyrin repeat protein